MVDCISSVGLNPTYQETNQIALKLLPPTWYDDMKVNQVLMLSKLQQSEVEEKENDDRVLFHADSRSGP